MFKKFFENKKLKTYFNLVYVLFFVFGLSAFFLITTNISDFLTSMENKTFDLRQSIWANSPSKRASKDIVVVVIDDASYEYLLDKYGEWPPPREIYANLINYLEKQKPTAIAFDLMFIKSFKSHPMSDKALVDAIKANDNVYVSMNFDALPPEERKPIDLPKKFSVNVKNDSDIDYWSNQSALRFYNCRTILPQILNSTPNVGLINAIRADDGILRKIPPFMTYKNSFYPHLAFMIGLKHLETRENIKIDRNFHIDKNGNAKIANRLIPLDKDGGVILNWYGRNEYGSTFQEIPYYKIVKAMEGKAKLDFNFKNKIVYVGTTAVSLHDAKSVPVAKLFPGVEVHATFINNFIDNNFVRKVPESVNVLISLILAIFIGFIVVKTTSTIVALGTTFLTSIGYILLSYYLMKFFNLWIAVVLPILAISTAFAIAYIVKYILKSRDFEHQYKLATTDGLTELYNHRYFQEQMIVQVENCKRYNSQFSLILIDIDFFKKFNDTFGHQSGDAVLVQVAQKLKKNVRATDFVCRYGGEEMSIILPNTDKNEAIITAQKICQTIAAKPFRLANDKKSQVTISLGVATYPEDGKTPSEIISHSDKCLYDAKENGRNQVGY